jgi:hypothetical protein
MKLLNIRSLHEFCAIIDHPLTVSRVLLQKMIIPSKRRCSTELIEKNKQKKYRFSKFLPFLQQSRALFSLLKFFFNRTVSSQNIPVREYENQVACEAEICEAFRTARKIKILTIRGERYFSTSRSLFYELYSSKKEKDSTIQMLVLSPQSNHISEELARKLGHPSAERIRRRMRIVLGYLKHLTELNNNLEVRCYNETPYLKILLFDDTMFVSSFTEGGSTNDHHAKMWQLTREGNPIFIGLERHFDQLWERSISSE